MQLFDLVENAIYRGITEDYAKAQNAECAIRARFISRSLAHSHAHQRLIPRVFYDLAISPCCADFINSTSYLPYSLLSSPPPSRSPLFRPRYSGYTHEFHE